MWLVGKTGDGWLSRSFLDFVSKAWAGSLLATRRGKPGRPRDMVEQLNEPAFCVSVSEAGSFLPCSSRSSSDALLVEAVGTCLAQTLGWPGSASRVSLALDRQRGPQCPHSAARVKAVWLSRAFAAHFSWTPSFLNFFKKKN